MFSVCSLNYNVRLALLSLYVQFCEYSMLSAFCGVGLRSISQSSLYIDRTRLILQKSESTHFYSLNRSIGLHYNKRMAHKHVTLYVAELADTSMDHDYPGLENWFENLGFSV